MVRELIPIVVMFVGVMLCGVVCDGCVSAEEARRADALRELGTSYLNEGSTEYALRDLEKSRDLNPRDANIRHSLGLAFFSKELLDEAEKEFLLAIRYDPKLTEAKLNLAALYIVEERYEEAVRYLQLVVDDYLYRSPARAYNNMGWAYYKMGKMEEALEAYHKATRIAPRFCQTHYNMGLLYQDQEDMDNALRYLEQSVEECPDFLKFRLTLAEAQVRVGRKGEALDNFYRVADNDPRGELGAIARERLNALQ